MDEERARTMLLAQRADLLRLTATEESNEDQAQAIETEPDDGGDAGQSLQEQGVDGALKAGFEDRLEAIDRALQRIDDGTYGRSVESGASIPDARLEADPAAELTVEEAERSERAE